MLLASDDEELSHCSSAPDSVSCGVYLCLYMFYVFIYFCTRITEMVFMYLFIFQSTYSQKQNIVLLTPQIKMHSILL